MKDVRMGSTNESKVKEKGDYCISLPVSHCKVLIQSELRFCFANKYFH